MNDKNKISRRNFLGQASCSAIGATTIFNTLFNLNAVNAIASSNSSISVGKPNGYKALVCLMNSGGIDSFNMLIPRSVTEYAQYANTRSNLAIPFNNLRPINPIGGGSVQLGLHPQMVRMQEMFENQSLAFVSNIGALVEPITKTQFYGGTVPIPIGLYSHADQSLHWQTGVPNMRAAQGWGGKIADLLNDTNNNQTISMNISLAGSNVFQTGSNTVEYSLDPENGSVGIIDYYNNDWIVPQLRNTAINGMVNPVYQNVFKKTYRNTIKSAIDGNEMFTSVLENAPTFDVPFTDNYISNSFRRIAEIIAGRDALDVTRQIFFVDYGGWDHHDELLASQAAMLTEVDNALYQFNSAMQQLGVHDKVTTFSLSEFSRTLTSNGNGTDHAWGGNAFMMGGAVYGRKIYGEYPQLTLGNANPLEIGGGSLIPTTSADEYFAELAMWFGVPQSDLLLLFPSLGNFYDTSSSNSPLGFLNMA